MPEKGTSQRKPKGSGARSSYLQGAARAETRGSGERRRGEGGGTNGRGREENGDGGVPASNGRFCGDDPVPVGHRSLEASH